MVIFVSFPNFLNQWRYTEVKSSKLILMVHSAWYKHLLMTLSVQMVPCVFDQTEVSDSDTARTSPSLVLTIN